MRALLLWGLGGMVLGACCGNQCVEFDPRVYKSAAAQPQPEDLSVYGARRLALEEVRKRHPTRALVDFANVYQTGTSPAVYNVHVEMTGAPDTRAIYEVEVSETPDRKLSVTGFTKSQ